MRVIIIISPVLDPLEVVEQKRHDTETGLIFIAYLLYADSSPSSWIRNHFEAE